MAEARVIKGNPRYEVFDRGVSTGTVSVRENRDMASIKRALDSMREYYNNGLYDEASFQRRSRILNNTAMVLGRTGRNPYFYENSDYTVRRIPNNRRG